jgi:hypothetical protein
MRSMDFVAWPPTALQKGENVAPVVGKFLLLCAMFLTGCATARESVTGPNSAKLRAVLDVFGEDVF